MIQFKEARMFVSKDVDEKLVISITDGKKLGEIKDLYLDQDLRRVTAVFLGKEGLVNRKSLAFPRSAVQVLGVDAWLVSGPDIVVEQADLPDSGTFTLVGDLRGREIQSEGGTKVGTVEDVILDEECTVLGFTLGKVFLQGPLAERKSIAREAITGLGSKNKPMTTVLEKAESLGLLPGEPVEPPEPVEAPPASEPPASS
jgi:sporulation protein YlmC with PRC-barrel domain